MNQEAVISIIRRHKAEFTKRGVTRMYLFGSASRDQRTSDSDVDLFYDYEDSGHFSLFDVMDVQEYAEQILGTRVDAIPRSSLHRRIREPVERDAVQVF